MFSDLQNKILSFDGFGCFEGFGTEVTKIYPIFDASGIQIGERIVTIVYDTGSQVGKVLLDENKYYSTTIPAPEPAKITPAPSVQPVVAVAPPVQPMAAEIFPEKIFGSMEDILMIAVPTILGIIVGVLSVVDIEEIGVVKFIKKKLSSKN